MTRWLFTLLLKPLDYLFLLLQVLYFPYFWFFVRGKNPVNIAPSPKHSLDEIRKRAEQIQPNKWGIVGKETHCLLTQSGVGLLRPDLVPTLLNSQIKPNGSIYRGIREDGTEMEPYMGPSRDGLTSWVHSYILWNANEKASLKKLTDHYISNCFSIRWNEKDGISSRGANFGLSPSVDGWPVKSSWWPYRFGLSNPTTGQDVLTSLSLLALASKELGLKYTITYYLYWIFSGALIHSIIPVMYTKKDDLYYVHHIAALNAWNLVKLGKPAYKWTLKYVCDYISPRRAIQPFITSLAINTGIMQDKKERTRDLLMSYNTAIRWPQYRLTSQNQLANNTQETWDMMYYASYLLR